MKLEINNTTKQSINRKLLQKAADIFGKKMGFSQAEVSLAIVGKSKIQDLNNNCRGIDKATDVLSFTFDQSKDFLGEIIICYQQIKQQAKQQGIPEEDELVFIFIHGLLHLVGYNDEKSKDREEMIKIGQKLCKSIV